MLGSKCRTSRCPVAVGHLSNHLQGVCAPLQGLSCDEELEICQDLSRKQGPKDKPFCLTVSNDATRSDREPGNVPEAAEREGGCGGCCAGAVEGGLCEPPMGCWTACIGAGCCSTLCGTFIPGGYCCACCITDVELAGGVGSADEAAATWCIC